MQYSISWLSEMLSWHSEMFDKKKVRHTRRACWFRTFTLIFFLDMSNMMFLPRQSSYVKKWNRVYVDLQQVIHVGRRTMICFALIFKINSTVYVHSTDKIDSNFESTIV